MPQKLDAQAADGARPLALFAFSNAESADTASAAATEAIIPETEQTKTSVNSPADNDLYAYYKCVGVRAPG